MHKHAQHTHGHVNTFTHKQVHIHRFTHTWVHTITRLYINMLHKNVLTLTEKHAHIQLCTDTNNTHTPAHTAIYDKHAPGSQIGSC